MYFEFQLYSFWARVFELLLEIDAILKMKGQYLIC